MTAVTQRPDVSQEPAEAPAGDRFVANGLFAVAGVFVVIQLIAGELIPPLAVPALIYAGLGAAVWRRRSRWLLVTIVVLAVVHLVSSIPFLVSNLAHPESPVSFISDAVAVIAVLAVAAGAVAGLRGARHRRPIAIGAGVVTALVVVGSLVAAGGVTSDPRQPGDVPVEAVRATFPAEVEVVAGGAALWADNQDPIRHTLVIEDTAVHVELPGSTSVRIPVDLAPGTYRYFCDVSGHERMEGELVAR